MGLDAPEMNDKRVHAERRNHRSLFSKTQWYLKRLSKPIALSIKRVSMIFTPSEFPPLRVPSYS